MDFRLVLVTCSVDIRYMLLFPLPTSHSRCPTSHFVRLLSYVYLSFRLVFAHFPKSVARPGGVHGAIETAALVVDKRWHAKPKTESSRYRGPVAYLSPPALHFPPADPKPSGKSIFCIFQGTAPVAEPNAKNLCLTDLAANLHRTCNLQHALWKIFVALVQFVLIFLQKCAPHCSHKHMFEDRLRTISLPNSTCWSLGCLEWKIIGSFFWQVSLFCPFISPFFSFSRPS